MGRGNERNHMLIEIDPTKKLTKNALIAEIKSSIADSKVTANIVNSFKNDIAGLEVETRMLTKYDETNLLPYYEAALEILTQPKN